MQTEMLHRKLLLLFFLFNSILLNAQYKIANDQYELSQQLKEKYPKASSVITSSEIRFEFKKDRSGVPYAIQHIANEFISLRLNHTLDEMYYYNNYSEIVSFTSYNNKNKSEHIIPIRGAVRVQDIFYHDQKFCDYQLAFNSIGEIKKTELLKKYSDLKYLTVFPFYDDNPILHRKVVIEVPDWLDLEIKEYNFAKFSITRDSVQKSNGVYEISYDISNMECPESEPLSRGLNFVFPHLLFLNKGYVHNNETHNIVRTKDDLYSWYHSLTCEDINSSAEIKMFTADLVKDCHSDEEKLKIIYYWVQDNIRYIAFEYGIAGFKPEKPENVFRNRYGDCKGMANLLKCMLKSVGIDARLTWLGTNSVLYDYSVPSLSSDNHAICTVIKGDKKLFLDGTESYSPLYQNAERIQGRQVLIENGENYIFDSIPRMDYSKNEFKKEFELEVKDNKLIGNAIYTINGENKTGLLSLYHSLQTDFKEKALKMLFKNSSNITFSNVEVHNQDNRDSALVIKAQFEIENAISSFNGESYVSLESLEKPSFIDVTDKRRADLFFNEKINQNTSIVLNLPDNMSLKNIPENLSIKNNFFQSNITYNFNNNQMTIQRRNIINEGYVPLTMAADWNKFVKQLNSHYKNHLVLTTVNKQ